MSERRIPIGVFAAIPMVIGFGLYAFTTQDEVEDPRAVAEATRQAAGATGTIEAALTPEPTATPDYRATWEAIAAETAAAAPAPVRPSTAERRGDFHDGAWVRVKAGAGDCLNARNQPSTSSEWVIVNFCLPDGFEGLLGGEAIEQDGHWWWHIVGAGYVAEEWLTFVRDEDVRARVIAGLEGRGRVAFLRGDDIWLMNSDGSNQSLLVDNPDGQDDRSIDALTASFDGSMLAYVVSGPRGAGDWGFELHVLNVADGSERVFPDLSGPVWSFDAGKLGVIAEPNGGSMDGIAGKPAVLDLGTGEVRRLLDREVFMSRAPALNFDGTLALLSYGYLEADTWFSATQVFDASGNIVAEIEAPEGEWYSGFRWSPVDNRIAMHASNSDGPRYAIYDLAAGAIVAAADAPRASDKIGGKCGSPDMWAMTWARDGSRIYYDFNTGDTGANGIWTWEIATGEQRLIPAAGASPAVSADGTLLYFAVSSRDSYIFAGDAPGGFPVLVTDGRSPAWLP